MKDEIKDKGVKKNIEGKGKGKIDGLVDEMQKYIGVKMQVVDY